MIGQEMAMRAMMGMMGVEPDQVQRLLRTIFEFADTMQRVEGKLDALLHQMELYNERNGNEYDRPDVRLPNARIDRAKWLALGGFPASTDCVASDREPR